jgi:catechol 2,3-dioxygenase-like lactoylglutathione lyase family enzyme
MRILIAVQLQLTLITEVTAMTVATSGAPRLAGIHHLKLPVRDLERSFAWYQRTLGYEKAMEFVERGVVMGIGMEHPAGGPHLGLRLDPERAVAAAGFDYFAIGVPDKATIEELAARLDALGESHAGVHFATLGWILPELHDPDGHEVRFYTIEGHTAMPTADAPMRAHDVRETSQQREAELKARSALA